jgi:hypothetical protein
MKKYVLIVCALFLAFFTVVGVFLTKSIRVKGFASELSNIHFVTYTQLEPGYIRADSPNGSVRISDGNLYYITQVLTNRPAMESLLLHPDVEESEPIVLTFPDGAVLTLYDGGKNDDGKDVTYVLSDYDGKSRWFSFTGLGVYNRVLECVSPEGFRDMGANRIIEE